MSRTYRDIQTMHLGMPEKQGAGSRITPGVDSFVLLLLWCTFEKQ